MSKGSRPAGIGERTRRSNGAYTIRRFSVQTIEKETWSGTGERSACIRYTENLFWSLYEYSATQPPVPHWLQLPDCVVQRTNMPRRSLSTSATRPEIRRSLRLNRAPTGKYTIGFSRFVICPESNWQFDSYPVYRGSSNRRA